MSIAQAYTSSGNGSQTQSASASTIAITPTTNTIMGDLIVAAIYVDVDATLVKDAGDGWVVLDSGYDSGNAYGMLLAVCIAFRNGNSGYAGLTMPTTGGYIVRPTSLHLNAPYRWDLSRRAGSRAWFNATASATAADAPAILQPYAQVVDIIGRGYENAAGTITIGSIAGWTEATDTGDTSPPYGVGMSHRQLDNAIQNPSVTSNLSSASTNRAGVRGMVGIIGNTMAGRTRVGSSRRAF
jgi:hypothetical protein